MKFTINVLKNLNSYGKEICIFSNQISKVLYNYSPNYFHEFSKRTYYFWRKNVKPIPISILIKIMQKEKIKEVEISLFSVRGGNKIFFPNEKNISFSYFLGLILGDGCLVQTKRGLNKSTCRIQISFVGKKELEIIKKYCNGAFGIKCSVYKNRGCFDLCAFSKPLVLILHHKYEIPIGKKYLTMKIPSIILSGNKKNKIAFLKGVFDSDGNIYLHRNKKSVQLRQKSERFLLELYNLFKEIGIYFNEPYYDKANNSWVLWSSKKDLVDNFIKKIISFKIEAPVAQPG